MSDLLHKAVRIAFEAHAGQSDKQGEPYIFHVMRVALAMVTEEERAVALLHDALEDGACDEETLTAEGLPIPVVDAVAALTRDWQHGEVYADYIERVALNPLAVRVKIEDLKDHLMRDPPGDLSKRYHKALDHLFSMMPADVVETQTNHGG